MWETFEHSGSLYDICLCKENFGPRICVVDSCRPMPITFNERILTERVHGQRDNDNNMSLADEFGPYCKFFARGGEKGRRSGGSTPVLVGS